MSYRQVNKVLLTLTLVILFLCMMISMSQAFIYKSEDVQLTGKLEAKAGFFTSAANGYTYPQYSAWQMFKERNLAYLQLDQNLKKETGLDLQYHLVGRAVYDGVYDFGPKVFREAYENNKAEFERYNTKWQVALWEAYANLKAGDDTLNLRFGRQNVSWGELLFVRVVDHINPLDNTWGGTGTESLDDRRIPLWMMRATYQPIASLGFEGFLVPGAIDATTPPVTPWGSPYGPPVPGVEYFGVTPGFNNSGGYAFNETRDMSHSRTGLKMTLNAGSGQYSLSYQNTYWDAPALRYLTSIPNVSPLINPGIVSGELKYPKVNIFGFSGNYIFTDADFIMRGDIAHVQGVPVVLSGTNFPVSVTVIDIPGIGPTALPVINTGEYVYRDFTNFGLSVEKKFWMRAINGSERVGFLMEYYGNYCHHWDNRMVVPIPDPVTSSQPTQKRYEHMIAFNVTSSWHMKWDVGLAALYNPSGSWLIIPAVTYRFNNPLTITVDYAAVFGGNWVIPFANDNDRDKLTLLLRYEF